jgi:3-hydroxyisobutyrate dehydrogenase-like beta-hydroxyacid dehydrogenase
MGKSIARNILKAGFPLVVHNRSQAAVEELVAEGAQEANSPAEVACQVDVVFTSLPDSPDVEQVALGPGGIIEGAHAGLIFVDNSTIKPATARQIAASLGEKGILCLDAPVAEISARLGRWRSWLGDRRSPGTVRPVWQPWQRSHVGEAGLDRSQGRHRSWSQRRW